MATKNMILVIYIDYRWFQWPTLIINGSSDLHWL
jgi:hypothetical protein